MSKLDEIINKEKNKLYACNECNKIKNLFLKTISELQVKQEKQLKEKNDKLTAIQTKSLVQGIMFTEIYHLLFPDMTYISMQDAYEKIRERLMQFDTKDKSFPEIDEMSMKNKVDLSELKISETRQVIRKEKEIKQLKNKKINYLEILSKAIEEFKDNKIKEGDTVNDSDYITLFDLICIVYRAISIEKRNKGEIK